MKRAERLETRRHFDKAPFAFEGKLKRLHFKNLQAEMPTFKCSPDDD